MKVSISRNGSALSADSGAFRSGRVLVVKAALELRHILAQGASVPRQTPADDHCLNLAAGFVIPPFAIDPAARERQLIRTTVILTQDLHRQVRWRFAAAIKLSQSSFACCHPDFSVRTNVLGPEVFHKQQQFASRLNDATHYVVPNKVAVWLLTYAPC
jgi:hypothetical protein